MLLVVMTSGGFILIDFEKSQWKVPHIAEFSESAC